MTNANDILKGVTEFLLRDCARNVSRDREREVRAVLHAAVGLAVVLPASVDAINDLFGFVCEHPEFSEELTPLEVMLTEVQRARLSALKLLSLETRSIIVSVSRPENPRLFN